MAATERRFYITTPIYYVNDRPHIGHIYTTTIADIVARYHRLVGENVFFLTGVDEHAAKVVDAAVKQQRTAQDWADENAAVFQETFAHLNTTNDDFIRTSQDRHKSRVTRYVRELMASGDVYSGQYEGWYDAGQEEYIPENKAKECDYRSIVSGQPLVRKCEKNYFFRLSKYQDRLQDYIEKENPGFVQPDARRNEVLGRIREGLNDVPISRSGTGGWGIPIPDDPEQTIYVWIDALFNYLSTIDAEDRIDYWPANVHFIAKDILWFHAVVWPAVLMALDRTLPRQVYSHSYWVSEGRKMSKMLGNFIDLEKIDQYIDEFGLDAFRYFLATEGPMGATDANFTRARFVEVYNSDLANTLGNCLSRILNMCNRYFQGKLPDPKCVMEDGLWHPESVAKTVERVKSAFESLQLDQAAYGALDLVRSIDSYIEKTQPFKLAKAVENLDRVGEILYNCAEAIRIASICLWPIMPNKSEQIWQRLDCAAYGRSVADHGSGAFDSWTKWAQLSRASVIPKSEPLFPRCAIDQDEPVPGQSP